MKPNNYTLISQQFNDISHPWRQKYRELPPTTLYPISRYSGRVVTRGDCIVTWVLTVVSDYYCDVRHCSSDLIVTWLTCCPLQQGHRQLSVGGRDGRRGRLQGVGGKVQVYEPKEHQETLCRWVNTCLGFYKHCLAAGTTSLNKQPEPTVEMGMA